MKHGAEVNATDHIQQTALHWAAVRGTTIVADLLLDNGARLEAADMHGYRVLFVMFYLINIKFLLWLISHGMQCIRLL